MIQLKTKILEKISATAQIIWPEAAGVEFTLDLPPDITLGDYAIGCFRLAKSLRLNPAEAAKLLAEKITADDLIEDAKAVGPYLNIRVKKEALFAATIFSGERTATSNKKIIVEYLSPNTNKPLHLGHVRNGVLGTAVINLLESVGNQVIKLNLINDRGIHICKSMLAWQKWGEGETPESTGMKGDHFVGKWYVRYAQEESKDEMLETQAQTMLKKWEAGDPETIALWKKMNQWVYDGFAISYKKFGFNFDALLYESQIYQSGKDIVEEGLKKNIFRRDEKGGVVFDLPVADFGLDGESLPHKITLLRQDGTSLYMTQDIGTALKKYNDYHPDQSIYVVASEQNYHFRCLFAILKALGYDWVSGLYHLSYAMVYLPEGKMKSREGKVIDADDLIDNMIELAREEIIKRNTETTISKEEIEMRSKKIGTAAIKFYLLRCGPNQDIHFDPKESISFEGATGPYCQYTYARAKNIIKKAEATETQELNLSLLGDNLIERNLALNLLEAEEKITAAIATINPSLVANHVLEISHLFNQFYHHQSIVHAETPAIRDARLALVKKSAETISLLLGILGIETMETM
jgi:arginyl-tRNA synthetase